MPRNMRPQNKNSLKHSRDDTMSTNPAITKDQFGSRHNQDDVKAAQRQRGRPNPGSQDTSFRESAQDSRANHSKKNKLPGRRFKPKAAARARRKAQ